MDETMEKHWRELSEEILNGMKEWRQAHPEATFREIEEAVHTRMSRLEAQMVPRYGSHVREGKLGQRSPRKAPDVSTVWNSVAATRETSKRFAGAGRRSYSPDAQLWNLSDMWDGSFSPSMSNWPLPRRA